MTNNFFRWQFMTDDSDIGFGVFKRTASEDQKKENMEEIVETQRVNSHFVPEDGSVVCKDPGTCELKKKTNLCAVVTLFI